MEKKQKRIAYKRQYRKIETNSEEKKTHQRLHC